VAEIVDAVAVVKPPGVRVRMKAAALFIVTPHVVAAFTMLAGIGLAVCGIYVLAGFGWALLAGAAPLLLLSAVLVRGLLHVHPTE
jgi:hypothetical protein